MSYSWRGLSVDVARSFFGPDVLMRLIDRMADLGLNRLHLHLTDDQGWRLDIPGRPELAAASGPTSVAGGNGGYLSVREWDAVVAHADARGIVVVPEIDLPGHVNAALHACPALNPGGIVAPAYTGDDVGFSFLSAGLPATEEFLHDVLGAVARMTPGPWLHIGGDECPLLDDETYAELVRLAAGIVKDAGKQPIAWQEGALAGLGRGMVLQYWRTGTTPEDDAARARLVAQVAAGADVILSPASHTYFDLKYTPEDPVGQDWAGTLSVAKARDWMPEELLSIDPGRILGVEAVIWTEYIHTEERLNTMLGPRLEAFAEVANQFRGVPS